MEGPLRDSVARTGVPGLDSVLGGGFPRGHLYLVDGPPGSGKTTLALQFLLEGIRRGERSVYVTLSESEAELRSIARTHGWSPDDQLVVCDLQSAEQALQSESQYTLFHPAEIELSETTEMVLRAVEQNRPERIVFDSLSEMRLLARDSLRYRRQILAMKHYFAHQGSTVLLLDTDSESEFQLASVAHGVLRLEQLVPTYGAQRRRLRVQKIRGASYREGYHDFSIETGGLHVFPRLVASEHNNGFERGQVGSGVPELDALIGGGLERGSSALVLGPSGAGKSTLATQFAVAAIDRGEHASVFLFDEGASAWIHRGDALGMRIREHLRSGALRVRQVNPAELTPGAFAHRVRRDIEDDDARLVVIDSLNGYRESMPEERFLSLHLHELLAYLSEKGVVSLLTMVQHGIVGDELQAPLDLSYVADAVLLLRFFEAFGEIRQAVSAVKNRYGQHEHKIRELHLRPGVGIVVGEQLREFTGVLGGALRYHGAEPDLLERAGS